MERRRTWVYYFLLVARASLIGLVFYGIIALAVSSLFGASTPGWVFLILSGVAFVQSLLQRSR